MAAAKLINMPVNTAVSRGLALRIRVSSENKSAFCQSDFYGSVAADSSIGLCIHRANVYCVYIINASDRKCVDRNFDMLSYVCGMEYFLEQCQLKVCDT